MIDTSFDFGLWLAWREFNFWSLNVLGLLSAFYAYLSYNYRRNTNTIVLSVLVVSALVFMLGFFPIEWGYSTDRANYAQIFLSIQSGFDQYPDKDVGFSMLTSILCEFLDVKMYFVAITTIYLANYLISVIKLVQNKAYWLLIAVILSMGFTNYALNTMRAGLALSFIVLSFSMFPDKWKMLICLLIGSSIHTSATIPSLMLIISYFFPKTKLYYKIWFMAIPISFIAGGMFMGLFAGMSDDSRTSYLLNTDDSSYNVGFRIDFILYSLAPVLVGWYYIFKRNLGDRFYILIYNSYILTNIFWILVIRANYSDRFAYLSWFLIPFVLTYPLLKKDVPFKENLWLAAILLGETAFRLLY